MGLLAGLAFTAQPPAGLFWDPSFTGQRVVKVHRLKSVECTQSGLGLFSTSIAWIYPSDPPASLWSWTGTLWSHKRRLQKLSEVRFHLRTGCPRHVASCLTSVLLNLVSSMMVWLVLICLLTLLFIFVQLPLRYDTCKSITTVCNTIFTLCPPEQTLQTHWNTFPRPCSGKYLLWSHQVK